MMSTVWVGRVAFVLLLAFVSLHVAARGMLGVLVDDRSL